MDYTFKLLAALLDYPTELTSEIVDDIHSPLNDCKLLDVDMRQCILEFASKHRNSDLLKWQMEYSSIFDVAPITSLYIFEHIYGSSLKRGAAMSSLKDTYADYGLEICNQELPDYLPVFLDFLSSLEDTSEALNYLADISEILKSISASLEKHNSEYALLVKPLILLAGKGVAHPLPESAEIQNQCPQIP